MRSLSLCRFVPYQRCRQYHCPAVASLTAHAPRLPSARPLPPFSLVCVRRTRITMARFCCVECGLAKPDFSPTPPELRSARPREQLCNRVWALMSSKNSTCSVYGMDAFYPGVHSPSDWISCLLFGKGLERSRRSQKIAKATLLISTIPVRSKCSGGLRKLRRNRNRFLSVPECSWAEPALVFRCESRKSRRHVYPSRA